MMMTMMMMTLILLLLLLLLRLRRVVRLYRRHVHNVQLMHVTQQHCHLSPEHVNDRYAQLLLIIPLPKLHQFAHFCTV